jgi:hypothetical protein
MADFCTIMTVVPTAGMDWSPPLGSGATDLWGLAFAFDPLLVAVAAAVADDAGADDGTVPDAALLASGALDGEPAAEFDAPRRTRLAAPAIRCRQLRSTRSYA